MLLTAAAALLPIVSVAAPPEPLEKARGLAAAGAHDRAADVLREYLVDDPDDLDALGLLALVITQSKRPLDALPVLNQLDRLVPLEPHAPNQSSMTKLAIIDLRFQAYKAANKPRLAGLALAERLPFAKDDEERHRVLSRLSTLYADSGMTRQRADALEEMLELKPDDVRAGWDLADAREALKHYRDARLALERLKELPGAQLGDVWRRIGRLYHWTRREVEAIAAYKSSLAYGGDHRPTLRTLAELYGWNDQPEQRMDTLVALIGVDPTDHEAREQLAFAYLELDKQAEAAAQLEEVVTLRIVDLDTQVRLAEIYEAMDDYDQAMQHLEAVHDRDASRIDVVRMLARLTAEQGDRRTAIALYQGLEEIDAGGPAVRKAMEELQIEIDPRLTFRYDFAESQSRLRHMGTVLFEHDPTALIGYRAGYQYAFMTDRTTQEAAPELHAHGGLAGVTFRLATQTYLDLDFRAMDYVGPDRDDPFFGGRIGWRQAYRRVFQSEVWLERREEPETLSAILADTAVYGVGLRLDWEMWGPLFFGAEAGYGHYRHTIEGTGERMGNNGYTWEVSLGIRAVEEPPLTFEIAVDYGGRAFETLDTDDVPIPYFAPDIYQHVGLNFYLNQKPHWRFEYAVFARPHWVFEDSALRIGYGAEATVKFHKRHFMKVRFERTDTVVGERSVIFDENLLMALYTAVF